MNIGKMILVYIVLGVLGLISGRGCTHIVVHPTNQATYIREESCMISTSTDVDQFKKLAEWCITQHTEHKK